MVCRIGWLQCTSNNDTEMLLRQVLFHHLLPSMQMNRRNLEYTSLRCSFSCFQLCCCSSLLQFFFLQPIFEVILAEHRKKVWLYLKDEDRRGWKYPLCWLIGK